MVDKFWKSCWIFMKLVCQGFSNQWLQKHLRNKFYENPRTFPKLVCYNRSVIFNFWNLTSALLSETPKTHRCQVSPKSNNFLKTRPPFWIFQIWPQICNQRPQKPPSNKFYSNLFNTSFKNKFFRKKFTILYMEKKFDSQRLNSSWSTRPSRPREQIFIRVHVR